MNKLKNCPECGKLYLEVGQNMCPACYDIELEQEQVVHTYIRDHDKCSIKQIVDDTGVKEKVVLRMIRSGRVMSNSVAYPCENCGKDIYLGRFCEACNQEFNKQVAKLNSDKKKAQNVDRSRTMYNAGREF